MAGPAAANELFLCLPGTDPDELWFTALGYEQLREAVAGSRDVGPFGGSCRSTHHPQPQCQADHHEECGEEEVAVGLGVIGLPYFGVII